MRIWTRIGLALLMVLGLTSPLSATTFVTDRFMCLRPPATESTVDPNGDARHELRR